MHPVLVVVEVRFRNRAWSSTLIKSFTPASSGVSMYVVPVEGLATSNAVPLELADTPSQLA